MIGFAIGAQSASPLPEAILLAFVSQSAALLPDLDLKLKIKHRGVTHSLLALFIVGALIGWFGHEWITAAAVLGYASHLFLDLLTIHGIELLYPWHRRINLLRFRTGGVIDGIFFACALCGALWCVLLLAGIVT